MVPSSPNGGADLGRSAALARLLRLLGSAQPADVPVVASSLPEADLAAAIEATSGQISLPLCEYVLTDGSSRVLAALARQVVRNDDEDREDIVNRILMRCDPEADEAFFDPEPSNTPMMRARQVIVRQRKGPDDRAIIPPRVKRLLLDAVATAAADGGPGKELIQLLAVADDPDLVLTLVPYATSLSAYQAANVIMTLDDHGLRKEAKRHRGLWAGRGSAFTRFGIRRFSKLPIRYPRPSTFSPSPDYSRGPWSVKEYRVNVENRPHSTWGGFARLRDAAWLSLRAGTMTAADVLELTRPAALAVLLAATETADLARRPGQLRAADDIRTLIARHAAESFGDDPRAWAQAVTWVNTYPGTILELFADPAAARARAREDNIYFRLHINTHLDPANILLAIAPRETAERALRTRHMKRTITAATTEAPLCRALVEHVIAFGTVPQRERLAANEATPDSVLARLLERAERTDIAFDVMERDEVGEQILQRAYAQAPRGRKLKEWIADRAYYDPMTALNALRGSKDDPAWILNVLRFAIDEFEEAGRIAAYALLAEVAGVEAVWAVELDVAGDLSSMAPYVRETMAVGNADPLIEAAKITPMKEKLKDEDDVELPAPAFSRTEDYLDHPLSRPLETLIRTRLDGRTNRWLELAELLQAKPEASDEELIAEFPVSAPDGPGD